MELRILSIVVQFNPLRVYVRATDSRSRCSWLSWRLQQSSGGRYEAEDQHQEGFR
jgi:hypothetical protein